MLNFKKHIVPKIILTVFTLVTSVYFCNGLGPKSIYRKLSERSTPITHTKKFLTRGETISGERIEYYNSKESNYCIHHFCTNVTNYPVEEIKKVLKNSIYSKYFSPEEATSFNIDNRFGEEEEQSLCETKYHVIFPKTAKNLNEVNKTIVNVEGHNQGIKVETCIHNNPCSFSENLPIGYTSYCKQKYTVQKLLIYDDNGGEIAFDSFKVPSCCLCVLKETKN